MKETVDPKILKSALDKTLERFSFYGSVLKRGLFWYYLDASDIQPVVREEYKPPCSPLYTKGRYSLLYEVTYYKKRIHLELFHVLSDGTGAMHFMRTLIIHYLSMKHKLKAPEDDFDASGAEMRTDSFSMHYDTDKVTHRARAERAAKLRGWKLPEDRLELMTGRLSVRAALNEAHRYGTTLTIYLCACLMAAILDVLPRRELKRPITACVPVNLRNFYASNTMRNFFNAIYIPYAAKREDSFEMIIDAVKAAFTEKMTEENLAETMNTFISLEKNVFAKMVPLALKELALKVAYLQEQSKRTFSISNVGRIVLPESIADAVQAFDIFGTTNQVSLCACSFQDQLSLSFTSPFVNADVQRGFFKRLTAAGIDVEITTNVSDGRDAT